MRRNWIEKCFSSIKKSSVPVQIIAIDNNSSDNSVECIKENFPETILLESAENLGFGGANNLGLKKALELGGEFFFLLNQDAWVDENTIEKLIDISLQNGDYAIISPIHLNGKGDKLDKSFSKSVSAYYCDGFFDDFVLMKERKNIYDSPFICAAGWLLTRRTLEVVGGFSPAFFHYGEDDNFCHRVLYNKMKIGVIPNAFIYHDRENRPNSVFDEKIISTQRQYTLWCSNPQKPVNVQRIINQYRNKIIKCILIGDISEAKKAREVYIFLKANKQIITISYKESISNKLYKFIF